METKQEKKERRRRGNLGLAIGIGLCVGLGFGMVLQSVVFGVSVGVLTVIGMWAIGVGARKEVKRQQ